MLDDPKGEVLALLSRLHLWFLLSPEWPLEFWPPFQKVLPNRSQTENDSSQDAPLLVRGHVCSGDCWMSATCQIQWEFYHIQCRPELAQIVQHSSKWSILWQLWENQCRLFDGNVQRSLWLVQSIAYCSRLPRPPARTLLPRLHPSDHVSLSLGTGCARLPKFSCGHLRRQSPQETGVPLSQMQLHQASRPSIFSNPFQDLPLHHWSVSTLCHRSSMRAPGRAPLPMTITVEPLLGPSVRFFSLPAGAPAKRSAMDEQPLQEPWNSHMYIYIYTCILYKYTCMYMYIYICIYIYVYI